MTRSEPFWETKSLIAMTRFEWESLCDRCGVCCLHRLKKGTTGKVYFTSVACRHLEIERCSCSVYNGAMRNCLRLSPDNVLRFRWLPKSCAYRLIAEKKELKWWHPLISGRKDTVHEAGISVRLKVISENSIHMDNIEQYMVKRPFSLPF